MKDTTKTRITHFTLALFAALAGYLLAGCDGGSGGSGATGFTDSPACDKADAIHVSSTESFATSAEESAYIADEAFKLCVGWSAGDRYPTQPDGTTCAQQLAGYLSATVAAAECSHVMTEAECSDVANDFVDSVGVKHTFVTVAKATITEFDLLLDPSKNITICTLVGEGELCLNNCD